MTEVERLKQFVYHGKTTNHQRMSDGSLNSVDVSVQLKGNPCWSSGAKIVAMDESTFGALIKAVRSEDAERCWAAVSGVSAINTDWAACKEACLEAIKTKTGAEA